MDHILERVTPHETVDVTKAQGKRRRLKLLPVLKVLVAVVATLLYKGKRHPPHHSEIRDTALVPTPNTQAREARVNSEFSTPFAEHPDRSKDLNRDEKVVHTEFDNEGEEIFENNVSVLSGFAQPLHLTK